MAILGLELDNLLGDLVDEVDDILGAGVGDTVDDLAPGKLIETLGASLDDLIVGDPTVLINQLLESGLVDRGLLNDILTGDGGALDLSALGDLLAGVDLNDLEGTLDGVFDDPLGVGDTVLDLDALGELDPTDVASVTTYVTSLVGAIVGATGDTADTNTLLDNVLGGDDELRGTDDKDDYINARGGEDTVYGADGNDTLQGGDDDDILYGNKGDDLLRGQAAHDTLFGHQGDDALYGGQGRDEISGGEGDDVLYGGGGADTMNGGTGDDRYFVFDLQDVVSEAVSGEAGGVDVVFSSASFTLKANIENLSLAGDADVDGTGNVLDNRLVGNAGDNHLSGRAGIDKIIGGEGVDTLSGGADGDRFIFEGAADSGIGAGNRDVISDFGDGDRIALGAVNGEDKLDFRGKAGFTGGGDGEVSFSINNGVTVVKVDADGNGAADFQIELTGAHQLTASDFLL